MVTICLEYANGKFMAFEVKTNDLALVEMITRGTLMASMAKSANAYNEEGFDICAYNKK